MLRHTIYTVLNRVMANPKPAGRGTQILVGIAITVVVEAIADFGCPAMKWVADLRHTVYTVLNRVMADPKPTGSGTQVLVGQAIAVVVDVVTDFCCWRFCSASHPVTRVTHFGTSAGAVDIRYRACLQQILIGRPVAVVVNVVANLRDRCFCITSYPITSVTRFGTITGAEGVRD
jgi:hypothetical protein